jgi:hypothetical protein
MRLQLDSLSPGEKVTNGSRSRKLLDYLSYFIFEQLAAV